MLSDERLAILERFGDSDTQELVAEIRRLRKEIASGSYMSMKNRAERAEGIIQELIVEISELRGELPL